MVICDTGLGGGFNDVDTAESCRKDVISMLQVG